jgi:hypothetical protein
MVATLLLTYDEKSKKITLVELDDIDGQDQNTQDNLSTDEPNKKETIIFENELFKYIYEINLESYIYYQ